MNDMPMAKQFIDLRPTELPDRFRLTAAADLCVGPRDARFLFGGVGLGAAIAAMERISGRKLICASASSSPTPDRTTSSSSTSG